MKKLNNLGGLIAAVSVASLLVFVFPIFTSADTGIGSTGETLGSFFGPTCLVPVFNTDFEFPPEGGEIIQTSTGAMYFVRTYMPGCENAGSIGTPIPPGTNPPPVVTPPPVVCPN